MCSPASSSLHNSFNKTPRNSTNSICSPWSCTPAPWGSTQDEVLALTPEAHVWPPSSPHSRSRARSPGPARERRPPPHAPGSTAPGRPAPGAAGTAGGAPADAPAARPPAPGSEDRARPAGVRQPEFDREAGGGGGGVNARGRCQHLDGGGSGRTSQTPAVSRHPAPPSPMQPKRRHREPPPQCQPSVRESVHRASRASTAPTVPPREAPPRRPTRRLP